MLHRLGSVRAEVDNGQPTMPQADIALEMKAASVRAAMGDEVGQALHLFPANRARLADNAEGEEFRTSCWVRFPAIAAAAAARRPGAGG